MNRILRALFLVLGVGVVGGVVTVIVAPRPGVQWANLVAAGLFDDCQQTHLECQVRNYCQALADGGRLPRYGTVEIAGYLCTRSDGGDDDRAALVVRWPRNPLDGGGFCLEPLGEPACVLLEDAGTCTDSTVCTEDGGTSSPTRAAANRCACRNPDAGNCFATNPFDGGALNVSTGVTIQPPFAGAGCVRKPCDEVAGEQGQSWPAACPVP